MGNFYTTVKVVSADGVGVSAEVTCGGTFKGYSDPNTGELSFDLYSNGNWNVSVKSSIYGKGSGVVQGGKTITIRLS